MKYDKDPKKKKKKQCCEPCAKGLPCASEAKKVLEVCNDIKNGR